MMMRFYGIDMTSLIINLNLIDLLKLMASNFNLLKSICNCSNKSFTIADQNSWCKPLYDLIFSIGRVLQRQLQKFFKR